ALLWRVHRNAVGALFRASNGQVPAESALLEDYAELATSLVDAFELTGDPTTLLRALELVDDANRKLARADGGWWRGEEGRAPVRAVALIEEEEPSGSASMLELLARLAPLTERPGLSEAITRAKAAHSEAARRVGPQMAAWLDAALLEAGPFYEVVIAAAPGAPSLALENAYARVAPPWAVRYRVPATGPSDETTRIVPGAQGKVGGPRGALAYVCMRGSCKAPTSDPGVLRMQLLEGWGR
ncbi:MAG: thioredoxin protein, partial [Myxococcaceae bacterium]|nr:thioredoxin protein [Myxococcaceae bacterium]